MFNKKYIYTVEGNWPNIFIDKKEFIFKDSYNYCVRELNVNSISLIPKEKCFEFYCDALKYQNSLIQQECNKVIQELNLEISKVLLKK